MADQKHKKIEDQKEDSLNNLCDEPAGEAAASFEVCELASPKSTSIPLPISSFNIAKYYSKADSRIIPSDVVDSPPETTKKTEAEEPGELVGEEVFESPISISSEARENITKNVLPQGTPKKSLAEAYANLKKLMDQQDKTLSTGIANIEQKITEFDQTITSFTRELMAPTETSKILEEFWKKRKATFPYKDSDTPPKMAAKSGEVVVDEAITTPVSVSEDVSIVTANITEKDLPVETVESPKLTDEISTPTTLSSLMVEDAGTQKVVNQFAKSQDLVQKDLSKHLKDSTGATSNSEPKLTGFTELPAVASSSSLKGKDYSKISEWLWKKSTGTTPRKDSDTKLKMAKCDVSTSDAQPAKDHLNKTEKTAKTSNAGSKVAKSFKKLQLFSAIDGLVPDMPPFPSHLAAFASNNRENLETHNLFPECKLTSVVENDENKEFLSEFPMSSIELAVDSLELAEAQEINVPPEEENTPAISRSPLLGNPNNVDIEQELQSAMEDTN